MHKILKHILKYRYEIAIVLILFFFSFFLRLYFFSGFILCDDAEELYVVNHVMSNGPDLHTATHIRFGLWMFNVVSFILFGISEFSFFLPTILMSSTLSIIGYYILTFFRYPKKYAFLAGLLIAAAPFEILIGGLRANDLIFSWLLVLALYFFIVFEKRPVIQGVLVASLLWLAFYVKLWVVYLLPVLGFYYLYQILKHKKWQGLASFFFVSLVIHGITNIIWKINIGTFFPYLYYHSATYPVAEGSLSWLFQLYPKHILQGSEFGTTLFGLVPYLLILLLASKLAIPVLLKRAKGYLKIDKLDIYLIAFYGSFFLLLNFFPNTFVFDQYYSAPRIFRYLTPISFPMTLHLAKLVLDFSIAASKSVRIKSKKKSSMRKVIIILPFFLLISACIYQADEATKPGQIYRENFLSIIEDVKEQSPPTLISEAWISVFLRDVYLRDSAINVPPIIDTHAAKDYEKWLNENQYNFPEGTIMITGLCSCLHYGCHGCGFRIIQFSDDLNSGWKLFREYGNLTYLPQPEPARLWIWKPSQANK